MLKQTADSTAPILSKLINLSISKGKLPSEWKTARVVPIPKPGSGKDTVAGYYGVPNATKCQRHMLLSLYWMSNIISDISDLSDTSDIIADLPILLCWNVPY